MPKLSIKEAGLDADACASAAETFVQAFVKTMGRRKAERFLCEWLRLARARGAMADTTPIRPSVGQIASACGDHAALAWLSAKMPGFVGAVAEE